VSAWAATEADELDDSLPGLGAGKMLRTAIGPRATIKSARNMQMILSSNWFHGDGWLRPALLCQIELAACSNRNSPNIVNRGRFDEGKLQAVRRPPKRVETRVPGPTLDVVRR